MPAKIATPFRPATPSKVFTRIHVEYGTQVYEVCIHLPSGRVMWVRRPGRNGNPKSHYFYDLGKPTGKAVAAKALKQHAAAQSKTSE